MPSHDHTCSSQNGRHAHDRLRAAGLRVTGARCAVLEVVESAGGAQSAGAIATALADAERTIDLVTVYRTLEVLERSGLVARVDRIGEGWRYAPASRHTHAISCRACGRSEALSRCELAQMERTVERSTGFSGVTHTLQFAGLCPDCRSGEG